MLIAFSIYRFVAYDDKMGVLYDSQSWQGPPHSPSHKLNTDDPGEATTLISSRMQ